MIFKYLQYSNIKISIDLNPFIWAFQWHTEGPTLHDPHFYAFYGRFLFASLRIIIDNGVWVS